MARILERLAYPVTRGLASDGHVEFLRSMTVSRIQLSREDTKHDDVMVAAWHERLGSA